MGFSVLLGVVFGGSVIVGTQEPVAPPAADSEIVIGLTIDAAYEDSEESLKYVGGLLEVLPPQLLVTHPGFSIPDIIRDRFSVTESQLPALFDLLRSYIVEQNAEPYYANDNEVWLRIPPLPPRAPRSVRDQAVFSEGVVTLTVDPHSFDLREGWVTDLWLQKSAVQPARDGRFTMLQIRFPGELEGYLAESDLLAHPDVRVLSQQIEVDFENSLVQSGDTLLTREETDALQSLLRNAKRSSIVFIWDSGWPSNAEYQKSRQLLRSGLDQIRKEWGLGFSNYSWPTSVPDRPGEHAAMIASGLTPLAAIAPDSIVQLIYIPVARVQGAEPLLTELVEVSRLADYRRKGKAGFTRPAAADDTIPTKSRDSARAFARRIVDSLPTQIDRPIKTNVAILNALWTIGELWTDSPSFFINISWTTGETLKPSLPENVYGLVVAAAGNRGYNVHKHGIDFAQRSRTGRVVAVMNIADSLLCRSSVVDTTIGHQMATGFDGRLSGSSGGCGSSFSAARIAWLLAASEVGRAQRDPVHRWAYVVQQSVEATRRCEGRGYARYELAVLKLVGIASSMVSPGQGC